MNSVIELAEKAKASAVSIATADTKTKNSIILDIAAALEEKRALIIAENKKDLENAIKNNMRQALIDRLTLNDAVISSIARSARQVAELPDPVGIIIESHKHQNGMTIEKISVAFGVIGIIFEARPNVTVDSALLCLKSGNAVILRGGSEAIHSNICLADIMREVIAKHGLDPNILTLITDTSRKSAVDMMSLTGYIDLLIPRGGAGLISSVLENAKMPVIETGVGNCHVYIDTNASPDMAASIIFNAKTSRPSVCNAAETLLVAEDIAEKVLPNIQKILDLSGVELRGCDKTRTLLKNVRVATEEDYYTEYNDYILAIKIVRDVYEAVEHINKYGTKHSESIVTENAQAARYFMERVDAAAVYHNASTRFTDGFEFGLGAEIGISTQKLHARGPMGLRELTTYKYRIFGQGQIR